MFASDNGQLKHLKGRGRGQEVEGQMDGWVGNTGCGRSWMIIYTSTMSIRLGDY